MEDKLFKIMSEVFDVPVEEINEKSSPDTIESGESIAHMKLVMALEEEFEVQFTDDQIVEMINVELILYTLKEIGI